MIGSTRNLQVFAYAQPADLRKGFDGLYGIVTAELSRDPLDGDCFLFVNRARSRAKVLLWDGGPGLASVELTMSELSLFLEGSKMVGRVSLSPRPIRPAPLAQEYLT